MKRPRSGCGWTRIGTGGKKMRHAHPVREGSRRDPSGRPVGVKQLKSLRCPCGFEVRSTSEDEIVQMARLHAKNIHGQEISIEQAKALIQIAA